METQQNIKSTNHQQQKPQNGTISEINREKYYSDNIYDTSKRFYYWDSYKNDDRSDLRNGGKFSDWYIHPRWANLKEEIQELDVY